VKGVFRVFRRRNRVSATAELMRRYALGEIDLETLRKSASALGYTELGVGLIEKAAMELKKKYEETGEKKDSV